MTSIEKSAGLPFEHMFGPDTTPKATTSMVILAPQENFTPNYSKTYMDEWKPLDERRIIFSDVLQHCAAPEQPPDNPALRQSGKAARTRPWPQQVQHDR